MKLAATVDNPALSAGPSYLFLAEPLHSQLVASTSASLPPRVLSLSLVDEADPTPLLL